MGQNGKGSSPRNCFSQAFRDNYDQIFMKSKRKCPSKQAYRMVRDDDSHWYVIKEDELPIFYHWQEAMVGRRHMPANFNPIRIDGPESVRFCEYWEHSK